LQSSSSADLPVGGGRVQLDIPGGRAERAPTGRMKDAVEALLGYSEGLSAE
jgi:hypothetical protein